MSESPKVPATLSEFIAAKKRKDCPVCKLAPDIMVQVGSERRKKKYSLEDAIEWLKLRHSIVLKRTDFEAHYSGRHEQ